MPKSDKQWKFGDGFGLHANVCDVPTEIFLVGCHSDAAFKTVRVEQTTKKKKIKKYHKKGQ